jgi:type VI secretion system protein ImpL
MKQLLSVIQGRKFLINLSLIIAAIWLLGPYIAIAGKMPFGSLYSRIITSLCACSLLFFLEYSQSEKKFSFKEGNSLPEEIKQELANLQNNIKKVLHTLHNSVIKSFFFRYKKPWYLVLGPTHAGKTTLLNKADINIKGLDNLPPMLITPTQCFNWWLADEAVFIDVGGKYLRENKDKPANNELLFQNFFKLLKKYRRYKPINGLILTINLQEMTVNLKQQSQLQTLRQVLQQLILEFSNFPIYLMITRCDMIEGFTEFFEDLGPEERKQIFGLSFPLTAESESLPALYQEQFNALLERLNERVIWRLQNENNLEKIANIKNFPLQMEFLKNPLAKLLNVILPSGHNLRGIFFTSTLQKDIPIDNLTKTLAHAFDITHLQQTHRNASSKNFFISEIFKRVVYPEAKFYATNNADHRLQFATSLLITLLSLVCIFVFSNSYRYNLETIRHTKQIIHVDNGQMPEGFELLIQHLNTLTNVALQLSHQEKPWYTKIGMQQTNKLQHQALTIYHKFLIEKFLPYLQQSLEIQLQNAQANNANQLYTTLKAYLMLGEKKHMNKKFFITWFDTYWQQLGTDSAKQQNLHHHLTALLEHTFKETALNQELIASKRIVLNNMPQSRLVFTILQNQYQKSPIKIWPNNQSKFNNLPTEIPGIYNIVNFKNVYYKEIMNTCKEISHGDWVLGLKPQQGFSEIALNQLSTEVQAIYLNEYAAVWADALTKIKIEEFQSLEQIVTMLEMLNDPQSPLINLVNVIKNNTQPISDSIEFTQQISSRFLALNSLADEVMKNTHQNSLMSAKQYLSKVVQAPDLDKASYEAAKNRMENQNIGGDAISLLLQQAHMLPEPLQTWHTTIAAESWRLLLKNTQNYLNRIWVATVYPQYQAILDKRYPLFKESTVDIALNDFANFFGNGGTMDLFFKNYLQPFIDNSRLYWEWKNIDGQRINISQNTLEMFIRAALIQRMFFPEDSKVPAINFSLVPVDLEPNVHSFTLELDGQSIIFQKDNEQIISLYWPGPGPGQSTIAFVDDQGKKTILTETGPWAWFKILDKSHLESTANPKHFKLTFYLNNNIVHYELYTNGIVNPFIPGILNAFRCPENLF